MSENKKLIAEARAAGVEELAREAQTWALEHRGMKPAHLILRLVESLARAEQVARECKQMYHDRRDALLEMQAERDRLRDDRDEAQSILASTADRLNVALREAGCPEISDDIYHSFSIRSGIVDLYDKGARLRAENKEQGCLLAYLGGRLMAEHGDDDYIPTKAQFEEAIQSWWITRSASADAARELEAVAGGLNQVAVPDTLARLRSIAARLRGEPDA